LRDEPLLISGLVRIACDVIAVQTLQGVVATLSLEEPQRELLIAKLARAAETRVIRVGLVGEAACFPEAMQDLPSLAGHGGTPLPVAMVLFYLYGVSGMSDLDTAYGLDRLEAMYQVAMEREPAARAKAFKASGIADPIPKYFIGTGMMLPALSSALKKEDQWRATLTAAMQGLDPNGELRIDPHTGKPLQILDVDGRRYFCSFGKDGIDNGIGKGRTRGSGNDDSAFFVPLPEGETVE
jgi:hypothetical protein